MKKLYSLLLAFVAASFSFTANASLRSDMTVTVNIDDVSRVSVSASTFHFVDAAQTEFKNGDNQIKFLATDYPGNNDMASLSFGVKDAAYGIKGTYSPIQDVVVDINGSITSLTPSLGDGYVYTITSFVIAEERSAKCTIWVDDASVVNCTRADNSSISLTSNQETEVAFAPSTSTLIKDLPLRVRASKTLYRVTLDGEAVAETNGYYYITPSDGSKVRIVANFPDVDVPVSFSGTVEAINKVEVDGVEVDVKTAMADGWKVKLGSTVQFWGNLNDYSFTSLTVNGTIVEVGQYSQWSYGNGYRFTVTTETAQTIVVGATKLETVQFTIDVDDPANVTVKKGDYYADTEISLVAGKNTIDIILAKTPKIYVSMKNGAVLVSFQDENGTDYSNTVSSYPSAVAVAEGKTFTIRTRALTRDYKCIVYVEGNSLLPYGGQVARDINNTRATVLSLGTSAKDGYTEVAFDDSENDFGVNLYGVDGYIYVNDDLKGNGVQSLQLNDVADGDVIKVYVSNKPDTLTVSMNVSEAVEGDDEVMAALEADIAIKKDIITDVDYMSLFAGIDVLTGTQIDITLGAESDLVIGYNSAVFAPDEDGVCHVRVAADGELVIMKSSEVSTGMQEVAESVKATKVVRDGRVLIIRGEEMFDVLGNSIAQ